MRRIIKEMGEGVSLRRFFKSPLRERGRSDSIHAGGAAYNSREKLLLLGTRNVDGKAARLLSIIKAGKNR